jgi:two-component system chemotaxis response regulator CheB
MRDADDFKRNLVATVRALGRRHGEPVGTSARAPAAPGGRAAVQAPAKSEPEIVLRPASKTKPEVLAIGSSTGGPQALSEVLRTITKSISLPILITQHMPPTFTSILATHIAQATGWPCAEARDGDVIESRHIYVARGGLHMIIESKGTQKIVRLSDAPPENFCRPAVDPMLRSIAKAYGPSVLVLILTGMGYDGRSGSEEIVRCGGTIIAQDKATSVVWGMPGAVATSGLCSAVLPLKELGTHVSKLAA